MNIIFSRAYFLVIAVGLCHSAVTWKTVSCDAWTWKGVTIDTIWDNALLMATNAQTRIEAIPSNMVTMISKPNSRQAGANAVFMYNIKWNKITGTDSAGITTMSTVKERFKNISLALEAKLPFAGNLPDLTSNNAFLFCGADALVNDVVPGNPGGHLPVWHYPVMQNGAIIEYLIFRFAAFAPPRKPIPRPCDDPADKYQARTFTATRLSINGGGTTDVTAVILCPNRFPNDDQNPENQQTAATLTLGFTATNPNPDKYLSVAGILVHEMTHVVGRSLGSTWLDFTYLFAGCVGVAQTNPTFALTHPDNYRVFAEMSMSPAMEWGKKDAAAGGSSAR